MIFDDRKEIIMKLRSHNIHAFVIALLFILASLLCGNVYSDYVYVTDYGATGDGVTDDSGAFQDAHDALGADGGTIFIPSTNIHYLISSGVTFTKPVRLLGEGWYGSDILTKTNDITVFTTNKKLDIENITFTALDDAETTAAFISVLSTASGHGHSTIKNCYFLHGEYSYKTESANSIVVEGCKFGGYKYAGLYLKNLINSDIGDSYIINNVFSSSSEDAIGIDAPTTAGLYICNNKFLNEYSHIYINPGTNATGNYLICNNSFEGHTDCAIELAATTGTITKTAITGNQFSSESDYHIILGNKTYNTIINGNIFNNTTASEGTGISIESGAKDVTITGNAFHQILNAVVSDSSNNAGITMSGNRFASDVTTLFSGENGINLNSSDKKITFTRFVSNTSDTTYVNSVKVVGHTVLEVKIHGVVQGVARSTYYTKKLISGTTISDLVAPVRIGGNFDVQIVPDGSGVMVGIKRASGVGSSVTMYVTVTVDGYVTEVTAL